MSNNTNPLKYQTLFSARSAFVEWTIWFFILLPTLGSMSGSLIFGGTFLGVTTENITYSIIIIFASVTIFKSLLDSIYLSKETRLASKQVAELAHYNDIQKFIESSESSVFTNHINSLFIIFRENDELSQDTLITILHDKLLARNRVSELFSSILITLGLIGTIMGLIIMVTELRSSLADFDPENASGFISTLMVEGGALAGLDTAFYTTLMGAILGGVMLRILTNTVESNITRYVSHVAELTEVHVLPAMRTQAAQLRKSGFY